RTDIPEGDGNSALESDKIPSKGLEEPISPKGTETHSGDLLLSLLY
ncbi:hypothetical protein HMPREF1986_02193, partial [Oribacterium sp. oral taxon 078 str. F0263]